MDQFRRLQRDELNRARKKHPKKFGSFHEAYAILLEEVDEFWDNVKSDNRDKEDMLSELVQIATMAQRAAEDLGLCEHTMTPEERCEWFDKGLAERGFVGIDNCASIGKCHKDEKHFVLVTDGEVVYQNDVAQYYHEPGRTDSTCVEERWDWFKFRFEYLDQAMRYDAHLKAMKK